MEKMNLILDEAIDELPPEILWGLNGGVILNPECKKHPKAIADDLYIMGQYFYSRAMGRYIVIYGGSFVKLYGDKPEARMRRELVKTLKHELTHHLESMAGERDLEIEDEVNMAKYKRRHGM